MLSKLKQIKNNKNGINATIIIYLLYLEKRYHSLFLKILRKLVWQPYLCINLQPSSFTLQSLLTLRLPHPYMIIIHGGCRVGEHCTIYHECTLGMIETKSTKVPTIMDNVYIGCKSLILGGVTLHKGVIIGAGIIVTKDVPANHTTFAYIATRKNNQSSHNK